MIKIKAKRIILHSLFWLAYLGISTLLFGTPQKSYYHTFFSTIAIIPFEMCLTYSTLYFLIPNYLLQFKVAKFVGFYLLLMILIILLQRVFLDYLLFPFNNPEREVKFRLIGFGTFYMIYEYNLVVFVASSIKLFKHWGVYYQRKVELEKENLKSELNLLRSQVNPHFLFNTLNNINSLVHKKSEKVSESIVKLSHIMRYMLYDSSDDFVLLENELEYLKDYLNLQQMRYKNEDYIELNISGKFTNIFVPPMLFISFIENAFKHGKKNADPPVVVVEFVIDKQYINFECTNKFAEKADKSDSGIGLKTVKKRLDYIYGEKYKINIEKSIDIYSVKLKIPHGRIES
jgi:two-component system, LytTR family, sensor kinase